MFKRTHICIYIYAHTYEHTHAHLYARARVCVYLCAAVRASMYECAHTLTRRHRHKQKHTHAHAHTRTHIHPPPHTHTTHTHTHTPRFASDCEIHCLMCFYLGQVEFFFWVFLRHLHCTGSCVLCSSRTLARLSVVDPKVALCRQGDVKLQELTNLTVVWYHGRINQGPFF